MYSADFLLGEFNKNKRNCVFIIGTRYIFIYNKECDKTYDGRQNFYRCKTVIVDYLCVTRCFSY